MHLSSSSGCLCYFLSLGGSVYTLSWFRVWVAPLLCSCFLLGRLCLTPMSATQSKKKHGKNWLLPSVIHVSLQRNARRGGVYCHRCKAPNLWDVNFEIDPSLMHQPSHTCVRKWKCRVPLCCLLTTLVSVLCKVNDNCSLFPKCFDLSLFCVKNHCQDTADAVTAQPKLALLAQEILRNVQVSFQITCRLLKLTEWKFVN